MASSKYHRLGALLVDIGTGVMRELLETCAKNEPGLAYGDLKTYLTDPKIAGIIKSMRKLRRDEIEKLYPRSGGVDEAALDVSLCSTLLIELYKNTVVHGDVKKSIQHIRDKRNALQHKCSTTDVTDSEFNNTWTALKDSIVKLAKTAKGSTFEQETSDKIDDLMTNNLPGLSNTWMEFTKRDMSDLRGDVQDVRKEVQNVAICMQNLAISSQGLAGSVGGGVTLTAIKVVQLQAPERGKKPFYRCIVFLSETLLAAVDLTNRRLVIYDDHLAVRGSGYRFKTRLSCVNVLADNKLVVAGLNKLYILSCEPTNEAKITLIRELPTAHSYSSVATISDSRFVGSTKNFKTSFVGLHLTETSVSENIIEKCESVSIFAFIGKYLKRVDSENMVYPNHVTYSREKDSLTYTTFGGSSLRIYSRRSQTERKVTYDDKVLSKPAGTCPGPEDSLFVCSWGTGCVVHVSNDGDILERHSLVEKPFAVAVNSSMNMLAVSSHGLARNELHTYKIS